MAPEASTTVQAAAQPHFAEKVTAIPVVASALDLVRHYYDSTKTRYEVVGKLEKELVEHVVPQVVTATTKATPLGAQALLASGLSHLDQYACTGLDRLEKNVPIIMEPTTKLIETGRRLVDERIVTPVDQLVEKALVYSEGKVEQFLPALTSAQNDQHLEGNEEGNEEEDHNEDEDSNNDQPEQEATPAKRQKLARAQRLGVEVTKRLSQRATEGYVAMRSLTPHDMQKMISTDVLRVAAANVEKQLAWLKENVESVLKVLHREDTHVRKLVETYTGELKASFAQALERVDQMTPANVKETSQVVLLSLSRSVADFVDKFNQVTASLSVNPAVASDPYTKKLLETVNSSITFFQSYAQSLRQLAGFQKIVTPAAEEVAQ